jgi:Cd2+/Zn2+-exporting ATPase
MAQATPQTTSEERPPRSRQLRIAGMDCGNCALTIENSVRQLQGVTDVAVSFTTQTMDICGDVDLAILEQRLKGLGYRLAEEEPSRVVALPEHRGVRGFLRFLWEQPHLRRAVIVAAAALAGLPVLAGVDPVAGIAPLDALFAAAVLVAGAPVFLKGFRALLFARRVTIDLLMAVAAIGALGIGATGEAVTVMLLFILGEALEAYSAERARDSLRSLLALQPQRATVLRAHEHGHNHGHGHDHSVTVPVENISVGERVLVRPGERIPVDGDVIQGTSSVNQAPVTGESVPVLKAAGDAVMAGTVNGEAALTVRVTRIAAEGTIARIAKLVEHAQAQRSPQERFIDRFARWYTPAVVLLAVLVVALPVLAFGQPLLDQAGARGWLYRGLALLIIACPCALVISIPVTVVSGLTRLAHLGVLVKGGAQLDRMADVRVVAFDKTGTLTHGKPRVTGIRASDCDHPADQNGECDSCDEVVAAAVVVERGSEHPVARAIVAEAGQRDVAHRWQPAQAVTAYPGRGVSGELTNGVRVAVGSRDMFDAGMSGWDKVVRDAHSAGESGDTVMYVAADDKLVGYIGVQDEIRAVTAGALQALAELRPAVSRVMLTGDNPQAAARVAERVGGIDEVRAGLMPDDKLAAIGQLRTTRGTIAMVGDGINDAPALASADVGIAMGGGGTAQAMETADVVLMQDDLSHVPLALRMARQSRRVIKENIALSLGLKLAFLALAIPGIATLWMAVLADVGATLLVTLNGMRLLRQS